MSIVEDSYYDHEEYGRVKVVSVTAGTVRFERTNETTYVNGIGNIPEGKQEQLDAFKRSTEPADLHVSTPSTSGNTKTNPPK